MENFYQVLRRDILLYTILLASALQHIEPQLQSISLERLGTALAAGGVLFLSEPKQSFLHPPTHIHDGQTRTSGTELGFSM